MKFKLFIGSSSESLFIAKELEQRLAADFDITTWDLAFQHGDYFLEKLYKELFFTDFGLFIVAPDDSVYSRGKKHYSARDNVIFELGMHIGALGIKKAYFVVVDIKKGEKQFIIKLPSDLDGIKNNRITIELTDDRQLVKNESNMHSLDNTSQAIKKTFTEAGNTISLQMLPSTSLAIGYFRNFIMEACRELAGKKDFIFDDKEYDMTKNLFEFYIVIPDSGSDVGHEAYNRFVRTNNLVQVQIKAKNSARTFPFFISTNMKNGKLQLYDLPTTLRASWDTIRLVMPGNTSKEEFEVLEMKEIANFTKTIKHLLSLPESADFSKNIHPVYASELFPAE